MGRASASCSTSHKIRYTEQVTLNAAHMRQKTVKPLSVSYTMMEDVSLPRDEISRVPSLNDMKCKPVWCTSRSIEHVLQDGYERLHHVNDHLEMQLTMKDWIYWAAYHAVKSGAPLFISNSHMLPLFTESASSPITIIHCMKTIKGASEYLNPGRVFFFPYHKRVRFANLMP